MPYGDGDVRPTEYRRAIIGISDKMHAYSKLQINSEIAQMINRTAEIITIGRTYICIFMKKQNVFNVRSHFQRYHFN